MPNIKNIKTGYKSKRKSNRKLSRKSSRKSNRKSKRKSNRKSKRKSMKKQYGGIDPRDIITTENRDMHIGRLVQIKLTGNQQQVPGGGPTDIYGDHFIYELVDKTFKIVDSNPFRRYALDDNFVALEPIHDYNNFFDMNNAEILVRIPSTFSAAVLYPNNYIVKLLSGSGISNIFTRGNINRSTAARQDFRRRRGLALTEHPAETAVIPSHFARRATNPMPFDASVTVNTLDGPVEVEIPTNVMEIIRGYM